MTCKFMASGTRDKNKGIRKSSDVGYSFGQTASKVGKSVLRLTSLLYFTKCFVQIKRLSLLIHHVRLSALQTSDETCMLLVSLVF